MYLPLKEIIAMPTEEREHILEPNCFHLFYKVMEGDWRSGGWSQEKRMTIHDLGDLARFEGRSGFQILRVQLAFEMEHTFCDEIDNTTILNAINERKEQELKKQKLAEIEIAKKRLEDAEKALKD